MGHSTSFKYYLVCLPHIWINSFFESFMKIGRKMLDFDDFDKSQMFLRDSLIQLWKQVLHNIIPLNKKRARKGELTFFCSSQLKLWSRQIEEVIFTVMNSPRLKWCPLTLDVILGFCPWSSTFSSHSVYLSVSGQREGMKRCKCHSPQVSVKKKKRGQNQTKVNLFSLMQFQSKTKHRGWSHNAPDSELTAILAKLAEQLLVFIKLLSSTWFQLQIPKQCFQVLSSSGWLIRV